MRRVIVLGATGFFGGALVEELKKTGITPLRGARHGSVDLHIDAEGESSLQSQLKPGDLILDAAGPFQRRTNALVSAASVVM